MTDPKITETDLDMHMQAQNTTQGLMMAFALALNEAEHAGRLPDGSSVQTQERATQIFEAMLAGKYVEYRDGKITIHDDLPEDLLPPNTSELTFGG